MSDNNKMKEYNINITSRLTGLSHHTLRAWERRYSIVSPRRNQGGHRLYNEDEVKLLKLLNDLCSIGHSISQLKGKKLSELMSISKDFGVENDSSEVTDNIDENPKLAEQSLEHLLLALEEYRLDVVSHEFYNMKTKLSPKDLALNVICPLMGVVGRKILEGSLSIAQEHALSSIIKFHLGQFMYKGREVKRTAGKFFILTTPERDYHEFGIILASLLCLHYGHNFLFLGPNMPYEALIEAAKSLDADEIILGSTSFENALQGEELDNYLRKVLLGIGKDKKLLVGGTGFFDISKFSSKKNFSYLPTLNHLDNYLKQKIT